MTRNSFDPVPLRFLFFQESCVLLLTLKNRSEDPSTSANSPVPPFGSPTSFPSSPSGLPQSVCQETVCPQMLATAQYGMPPTTFLFARKSDGTISYRQLEVEGWKTEWQSLGGTFLSQPGAASMRNGRVEVFGVWNDSTMRVKTYQNGVWDKAWTSLGGECSSPPSVCSLKTDDLNVVATANKSVIHKYTDGHSWAPTLDGEWEQQMACVTSSVVAACSGGAGRLRFDLVVYGCSTISQYGMYYKRWNNTGGWDTSWSGGWGSFRGDPVAVSATDATHYFGVGTDKAIWHSSWPYGGVYTAGESLNGSFQSAVFAFATGTARLDVLAVGLDARLRHKARLSGTWATEWEDLGGYFNSAPTAILVGSASQTVVVFGLGPNGNIIHAMWNRSSSYTWGPGAWFSDGGSISANWYQVGPALGNI